jgi:leucyl aminopeptidase (aminopeptidase T)
MNNTIPSFSESQRAGASWILREALGASGGSAVLVLHDERTEDVARCIEAVAGELDISLFKHLVASKEQREFRARRSPRLNVSIREDLDKVSRAIILQEWDTETTAFRLAVLDYCTASRGKRVASMPGVMLSHLDLCSGNLDELTEHCRLVADRLLWARTVEVRTSDLTGAAHTLHIPVGRYTPRTSTGRVPLQGWCNVPSGETFIVPDPHGVRGRIVVNGSLPSYPLPPGEELVLTVEKGTVQHPVFYKGDGAARVGRSLLHDDSGEEVSENCTVVSELGVGLNPGITRFTGLPIFDEKMLGTIHLGLGSSQQFGGPTACEMHNDFVIRRPSVYADGDCVVCEGAVCLTRTATFPHWKAVEMKYADPNRRVVRTGDTWREKRERGRILAERCWISDRSEGETKTQIGDDETAALATLLLWALENHKGPATVKALQASVADEIPTGACERVLELLMRFRLIREV